MGRLAAVACVCLLCACGGDSPSSGQSAPDPPDVAGTYTGSPQWTLQVLRTSDNFQKSFTCSGRVTLSQGTAASGVASLTGFVIVGVPCEPVSYELSGTVHSGGSIAFTSGGPRPTEGPCPGASGVQYTGQISGRTLSARGVTTVQCPEFGGHVFTYVINALRN